MRLLSLALVLCCAVHSAAFAKGKAARAEFTPTSPEAKRVFEEVKKTFGFVPEFMKSFPENGIAGAWDDVVALEMGETAIPGKYKSMISLGVGAQIPCKYCTYIDSEFARVNGATEEEVRECGVLASIVRRWSTVLNGMQMDETAFRAEVARVFAPRNGENRKTSAAEEIPSGKAEPTYKEIAQTFGFIPSFLRFYPEEAIGGAWNEFKAVQLSDKTRIPNKYKELIGLGISAQIPCRFCVHFHTEAARANGATDREIREAVAVAASARHWSTFWQAARVDEAQFRRDVQRMVEAMKKQAAAVRKAEAPSDRDNASREN